MHSLSFPNNWARYLKQRGLETPDFHPSQPANQGAYLLEFYSSRGGLTRMLQSLFGRRTATASNVKQLRAQELWDQLQNGNAPLLVDVRTPQEFEWDGHIAGSRLLPLQVLAQRHHELPKDQAIVCVCRSGNRSQVACEQLANMGFDDLTNLAGGMIGWKSSGLPIE